MRPVPVLLMLAVAAGGAFAQSSTPSGTSLMLPGESAAATPSTPSVPSRPMTAGSTGTAAMTDVAPRGGLAAPAGRDIGGSGSAGLAAMGGGINLNPLYARPPGDAATLGGSAAPAQRTRTPAPTMHDGTRDACPPGLARTECLSRRPTAPRD